MVATLVAVTVIVSANTMSTDEQNPVSSIEAEVSAHNFSDNMEETESSLTAGEALEEAAIAQDDFVQESSGSNPVVTSHSLTTGQFEEVEMEEDDTDGEELIDEEIFEDSENIYDEEIMEEEIDEEEIVLDEEELEDNVDVVNEEDKENVAKVTTPDEENRTEGGPSLTTENVAEENIESNEIRDENIIDDETPRQLAEENVTENSKSLLLQEEPGEQVIHLPDDAENRTDEAKTLREDDTHVLEYQENQAIGSKTDGSVITGDEDLKIQKEDETSGKNDIDKGMLIAGGVVAGGAVAGAASENQNNEMQLQSSEPSQVLDLPSPHRQAPTDPPAYGDSIEKRSSRQFDVDRDENSQAFVDLEKAEPTAATENRHRDMEKGLSKGVFLLLAILCLAVIAGVVVLAVLLTKHNGDNTAVKELPPTASPTLPPTPSLVEYTTLQNLFGAEGWGFGASVALSPTYIAVGAPDIENGTVVIYESNNETNQWNIQGGIEGSQAGSLFGTALDFTLTGNTTGLLVGAPLVFAEGTPIPAGAAYYYEYSGNELAWKQVGPTIQGGNRPSNANEEFGHSVAISANGRVAIGAPKHRNVAGVIGRVYTYILTKNGTEFGWKDMSSTQITGNTSDGGFGSSVDISQDGDMLLVGEPSSDLFHVLMWTSNDWENAFTGSAESVGERFGSSVVVVSDKFIAVGGPLAGDGAGVIRIYQKNETFTFSSSQIISGESGEGIGYPKSMSAAIIQGKLVFFYATATGLVKRLDYVESSNSWLQRYEAVDTGFLGNISSIGAGTSNAFVVGSSGANKATIFDTVIPVPTILPTISPTVAPTASPINGASPTNNPSPVPHLAAVAGPFAAVPNSGFGSSVAMTSTSMVAGAPKFGTGVVQSYVFNGQNWAPLTTIPSVEGGEFGYSVAMAIHAGKSAMVVGAPGVVDASSSATLGAAYYFTLSGNSWKIIGSPLKPPSSALAGRMGESVAIAESVVRVAVGAPNTSQPLSGAGKTYVFEYIGSNWTMIGSLDGIVEQGAYGSSIAISNDGNRLLIGGPGDSQGGGVLYYDWNGTNWINVFLRGANSPSDLFGSAVAILDTNGDTFAVGAPGANSGNGAVRIFGLQKDSTYSQLGNDIVGGMGDSLGASGTISGLNGDILLGTANGAVRRYVYDGTEWIQDSVQATLNGSISSLSTSTGSSSLFTVGTTNGDVTIYSF